MKFLIVFLLSVFAVAEVREEPSIPTYDSSKPLVDEALSFKNRDTQKPEYVESKKKFLLAQEELKSYLNAGSVSEREFKKLQSAAWKSRKEMLVLEQVYGTCATRPIKSVKPGYSISDGSCVIPLKNTDAAFKKVTDSLKNAGSYPRNYSFDNSGLTHVLKFDMFEDNGKEFVPTQKKEIDPSKLFYTQIAVDTFWGSWPLLPGAAFTYFFEGSIKGSENSKYKDFYLTYKAYKGSKKLPEEYTRDLVDIAPAAVGPKVLDRVDLGEVEGMWYVMATPDSLYLRYRTYANFKTIPNEYVKKSFLLTIIETDMGRDVSSSILLDTLVQLSERANP